MTAKCSAFQPAQPIDIMLLLSLVMTVATSTLRPPIWGAEKVAIWAACNTARAEQHKANEQRDGHSAPTVLGRPAPCAVDVPCRTVIPPMQSGVNPPMLSGIQFCRQNMPRCWHLGDANAAVWLKSHTPHTPSGRPDISCAPVRPPTLAGNRELHDHHCTERIRVDAPSDRARGSTASEVSEDEGSARGPALLFVSIHR